MGVSEASIAEHMARHGAAEAAKAIEVWECHLPALSVYQRCQHTVVAGAAGAVFLGMSVLEIEAACRAAGVPFDADLIDDVQTIAKGAAKVLNQRKK